MWTDKSHRTNELASKWKDPLYIHFFVEGNLLQNTIKDQKCYKYHKYWL